MTRRNYPFHKRDVKRGSNLISGLLACLIVAPFAIVDSLPESSKYDNEQVDKTSAIIFLIIGIALAPLFIPLIKLAFEFGTGVFGSIIFMALIFLPVAVWGGIIVLVIQGFTNSKKQTQSNFSNNINQLRSKCDIFVDAIVKASENNNLSEIRTEYYKDIDINKNIEVQIQTLNKNIYKYNKKLNWLRFLPKYKCKYISSINSSLIEISNLEKLKKTPIIKINKTDNQIAEYQNEEAVFLALNTIVFPNRLLNFWNLSKSGIKNTSFFDVNNAPILSLYFTSIELLFYSHFIIVMTENNFSIIDYKDISTTISIRQIIPYPSSFSSNFNIINTQWKHSCLDGSPDLRYKNNLKQSTVQVKIVELEMYSQKLSLIFNETNGTADFIFNLIKEL